MPNDPRCPPTSIGLQRLERYEEQLGHKITEEWLRHRYLERLWSLPDFKRECGFPSSATLFLLDHFDIPRRSVAQATALGRTVEKRRATSVERFGVINPSMSPTVKEKKAETFMRHYGVDNIFKTPEFIAQLPGTMNARYGKGSLTGSAEFMKNRWATMAPEVKAEMLERARKGSRQWWSNLTQDRRSMEARRRTEHFFEFGYGFQSGLEETLYATIKEHGIDLERQFFVGGHSFDFRIPGQKLLIETHGDFWHANPSRYRAEDILPHPGGDVTARELWERDALKQRRAAEAGYAVMVVWEADFPKLDVARFVDMLRSLCEPTVARPTARRLR
jgi:G:T-mismatch repair DNA endonuclease (very short patch repair protein)